MAATRKNLVVLTALVTMLVAQPVLAHGSMAARILHEGMFAAVLLDLLAEDRDLRHRLPQRGFVTAIGLGANRPQDAVYPTSEVDADGKPYSSANKYVMHLRRSRPRRQTASGR